MEITEATLAELSKKLGPAIQAAIEECGLVGYQIERFSIKKKPEGQVETLGLIPECHAECTVGGVPPHFDCEVRCG